MICCLGALLCWGLTVVADPPEWWDSQVGTPPADWVPAPFEPVQVVDASGPGVLLQVVGRQIRIGADGLPAEIQSAGAPLLAEGGVVLQAVGLSRHPIQWQPSGVRLERVTPRAGRWTGESTSPDGWRLRCEGSLDYDGLIVLRLTLAPPPGGGSLDRLRLRAAMPAVNSILYHTWPGRWGSVANSGAVPADGLRLPFKPILWLGDDDRGLSFCAESDQGWLPADPNAVLRVERAGALRLVDMHLIEQPVYRDQPWRTTVMLHPTPIKPMPADPHVLRLNHGGAYGLHERRGGGLHGEVVYPAEAVLDPRAGTLEAWIEPGFIPDEALTPAQRANRGQFNREFLNLLLPNGDQAGFYWNIDDRGMRYYLRRGRQHPVVRGGDSHMQLHRVSHIALSWGEAIRIYADGELVAEAPFEGLLGPDGDLTGARLVLGGWPSEFGIHAVRVSRHADDLSDVAGPPQRRDDDLLWELGGDLGEAGSREGGRLSPGLFGPAWLLFREGETQTALDELAGDGVRTLAFHEHWTAVQNSTVPIDPAGLRALADACHQRGMRLIVYFGFQLSDLAPEWEPHQAEFLVAPRQGAYQRQPTQTAYTVCYASRFTNYLLHGIARLVDECGIDGVYLDGTIEPWACTNAAHGCGYLTPAGERRPTYPILAVRQLLERMHRVLAERRPEVIIDAHQSTCLMTPTMSWCSGYWDGEQLTSQGVLAAGRPPLETLPLETFRAEFSGRQIGIPAMFLNYAGRPFSPRQALALALLHDVTTRGHGANEVHRLVSQVWRAWDDFSRATASVLGYWQDDLPWTVAPGTVRVTGWRQPDGRLLLAVVNLGEATAEAAVTLAAPAGGPTARAWDALTNEGIAIESRTFRCEVESLGYRLIRVDP